MKNLSIISKAGYGLGAFGKDMVYSIVATFIMFYFTDVVGIAPLFLGFMFFASRIWDAVNDPMMGMIVDNTRTRFGKFRPWILMGTLINSVFLILLFYHPGIEGSSLYIYITVAYILWGMSYTMMDIPYWSMIPALSTDPREREAISVIPRVAASIGFFLIASLGLPLVKILGHWADSSGLFTGKPQLQGQSGGFFLLAILIAICFIITLLITVLTVKEKKIEKTPGTTVREMIQVLLKNDQAQVVMITMIVFNTVIYLTSGLGLYFFKYNLGKEMVFSQFTIVAGVSQVLAMLLFPLLTSKLRRSKVFSLSVFLPVVGYLMMLTISFLAADSILLLMISGVVLFLGLGISQVLSTVMLADTVDYGEWKLGKRNEGIIFSMQPFVVKFSTAVAALLTGAGLTVIGFQANQEQTAMTLLGIKIIMFIVPIFGLLFSLYIFRRFFKIDEEFYSKIQGEIITEPV